ncbi:hypothetical protein ScPMuIL_007981 [Solemya velum]
MDSIQDMWPPLITIFAYFAERHTTRAMAFNTGQRNQVWPENQPPVMMPDNYPMQPMQPMPTTVVILADDTSSNGGEEACCACLTIAACLSCFGCLLDIFL